MAYRCEICGKRGMRGNLVSHSKQRTKHIFRPNLRWSRIVIDGMVTRARVCTDCLRKAKREVSRVAKVPRVPREEQVINPEVQKAPEVSKMPKEEPKSADLELAQKIVGGNMFKEEEKPEKRGKVTKKLKT